MSPVDLAQRDDGYRAAVIPPLVERHVGDAAFYWTQHDRSVHSPLVDLAELRRFDHLLDAHLDGTQVAGETGWQLALAALARWRGSGEAFVCTVLALGAREPGVRLAATWAIVEQAPERMLRGVIGGLLWVEPHLAAPWAAHWTLPHTPVALQIAAWRVLARAPRRLRGDNRLLDEQLASLLAHPDARLRATACRAAYAFGQVSALHTLLTDADTAVAAEAAIGLSHAGLSAGAGYLWRSVQRLAKALAHMGGAERDRAEHRLARWVRHLALMAPLGHPDIPPLIDAMPVRVALLFILHHGDGALLPWVRDHLEDAEAARLAGWVWSALVGRDLVAEGLAQPSQPLAAAQERLTDRLDPGLPLPDANAVRAQHLELPQGVPCLLGETVTPTRLPKSLHNAPQALRWIAARRIEASGGPRFDTRAHAHIQYAALDAWPER